MALISRRSLLRLISAGAAWFGFPNRSGSEERSDSERSSAKVITWSDTHDRAWLSGECWANPMEDWRVVDGAAECGRAAANRNVHLLTHQLADSTGDFEMSIILTQVELKTRDGGAGFRIGVRSDIDEHRSNSFARGGVDAGIVDGQLVLGSESKRFAELKNPQNVSLRLTGAAGDRYRLTLVASSEEGRELGRATTTVAADSILGNVAIVNNFGREGNAQSKKSGSRYRFNDWSVSGNAFSVNESYRFGPILWSMYSLSDSRSDEGFVLKISALTGPLGANDAKEVELLVQSHQRSGDEKNDPIWESLGFATLDPDAWTATFRIPNWDAQNATPYKLVYREKHRSGSAATSSWEGMIKASPKGRPLRLAALTCQKDYSFPYAPVIRNIARLDPDMLYFSGDQIYEDHGGFGLIREPADRAILNYLRKFYMFGWAFRHALRNAPTICLPDDHDVFQGNIWGESGRAMKVKDGGASSSGGYREPPQMINVVHKTTVGHHPDCFDATPVQQGISVYFGDMVYGDVSFAIVADRQFKSGPEQVDTGPGRADHVPDVEFDTAALDKPGLVLLGERQEEFLRRWANDWRGHSMKVLLSQTVFAGVATHHGENQQYLKADLDSGAWPQTARDNAITILRPAMPLHICGDQHLTSLVQYGVEAQRDSFWSFCTPAVSAGYPRWWRPDDMGMPHEHRPTHGLPNTGEFTDGCGNLVYVYAIGNPDRASKKHRYELAHQKGSGFGFVSIDTVAKTYRIDSFRFLVDVTDGKATNQFPGWPVTIHQEENTGRNRL